MAEVKIESRKPAEGQEKENWRQPVDTIREDLFNEVIYGLTVLHASCKMADYPSTRGISFALDYVKAMKEMEA